MINEDFDFLDEASDEVEAARQWYASQNLDAARRFNDEMDAVLQRISDAPDRWPKYTSEIRKCRMNRFPYPVFYRQTTSAIQIIAVAHGSRRPGYWKDRVAP